MTKRKPKVFPPPKFVYTPPPSFKTKGEELEWLKEENRRWIEGYGGLTGPHYFYLTQFFIKKGTDQLVERPIWRDCDQYIFEQIDLAMKNGEDLLWISRREIGKSSIIAGMAVWTMRVFAGSTSMITSSNKGKINTLFSQKIYDIFDGGYFHPFVQGTKKNHANTQNNMYYKVLYQVKGKTGAIENRYSEIVCVETNETPRSPTNMSSRRAKFVCIDEIGLHERRKAVLQSSEDTMTEGGKRTGFRMLVGTIEKDIPSKSVAEIKSLVKDAESLKIRVIFTPYWAGSNLVNGHSDRETSEREWKEDYDRLNGASDKSALNAFVKNRPPDLETALSVGGAGNLPQEVMNQIGVQEMYVRNNPRPIHRGVMVPNSSKPNGYDFSLNATGSWYILEHPQAGETYIGGIDPIPFNTDNMSDENSRHVTVIMKKSTREVVAIYKDRSPDPDEIYRKAVNGQKYYNNAVAMLEVNAGQLLHDRYKQNRTRDLLANTPVKTALKPKGLDGKGFWKAGSSDVDTYLTELLVKYLLENSDKLWFDEESCSFFQEFPMYLEGNTDIISALLACLLYLEELDRRDRVPKKDKPKTKKVKFLVHTPQGMMPKWINMPIRHGANEDRDEET